MFEIDALATALPGDNPAGRNLENDASFIEFEQTLRGQSERAADGTIAYVVNWADVRRQGERLMQTGRDLRVAVALTSAYTQLGGLEGLVDGLELVTRLCTDMWSHVHPQLDADDDNDPTMRMNALAGLSHIDGLLQSLRAAPLLSVPGVGVVTVRTAEIVLGILPMPLVDPPDVSPALLRGMVADAVRAGSPNHAARAVSAVGNLASVLAGHVGASAAPDLRPLAARLKPFAVLYLEAGSQEGGNPAPAAGANPVAGSAPAPSARQFGEITSRADALNALQRVCSYLETHEPTNPAPLLIRRAQRLMTMSFVDIVRDMAPDSFDTIARIAGITDNDSS